MDDALLVHIVDSQQNLLDDGSCFVLGEFLRLENVTAEVSTCHQFHDHIEVSWTFQQLHHSHDIRVLRLAEDLQFLLHQLVDGL